jgi:hypothetical protein
MTLINIILAILGLTSTLAAFGGETWKKGNEPLIDRITKRGFLSLFCLLSAFSLGVFKEIKINQQKSKSEADNKKLLSEIAELRDSLSTSSKSIIASSKQMTTTVEDFKSSNCEGLERAFKLAVNIPREYDDCVVTLDGEEGKKIPGRITDPMELYWGDSFEFTFLNSDYHGNVDDLKSIKLEVGEQTYDLHNGENVYNDGQVRIYGSSPKPMVGYISNPLGLSGIKIKIFVRSTDASRGQEAFKKMVLQGQCSEFAKKVYKVTNTEIVRLRSQANENGAIKSTLSKGSFVRTLQVLDGWTEVVTPESRQGWIKSEFLSIIQ